MHYSGHLLLQYWPGPPLKFVCYRILVAAISPQKTTTTVCLGFCLHPFSMVLAIRFSITTSPAFLFEIQCTEYLKQFYFIFNLSWCCSNNNSPKHCLHNIYSKWVPTYCPPPVHSALSRSVLSLVLTQRCPGQVDSTLSFSAFRAGSAMSQPALSLTLSCPVQQAVKEICKYLLQIFKSLLN